MERSCFLRMCSSESQVKVCLCQEARCAWASSTAPMCQARVFANWSHKVTLYTAPFWNLKIAVPACLCLCIAIASAAPTKLPLIHSLTDIFSPNGLSLMCAGASSSTPARIPGDFFGKLGLWNPPVRRNRHEAIPDIPSSFRRPCNDSPVLSAEARSL